MYWWQVVRHKVMRRIDCNPFKKTSTTAGTATLHFEHWDTNDWRSISNHPQIDWQNLGGLNFKIDVALSMRFNRLVWQPNPWSIECCAEANRWPDEVNTKMVISKGKRVWPGKPTDWAPTWTSVLDLHCNGYSVKAKKSNLEPWLMPAKEKPKKRNVDTVNSGLDTWLFKSYLQICWGRITLEYTNIVRWCTQYGSCQSTPWAKQTIVFS